MALWNAQHVLRSEDRLSKLINDDFAQAAAKAHYATWCEERTGTGVTEFKEFLLTSQKLNKLPFGQMQYADMLTAKLSFTHEEFGEAITIDRRKFEDDQFDLAADAARNLGTAAALHPQTVGMDVIKNGASLNTFDGVPLFSASHPDFAGGTYSNVATSTALTPTNFDLACAAHAGYKMPNGIPRNLAVEFLVVPPALRKTALEIAGGEFLGSASGTATTVTASNVFLQYGVKVVVAPELAGADTTWYTVCSQPGEWGKPVIYSRRSPFTLTSYDGISDAELGRTNQLEWQMRGFVTAFPGMPWLIRKHTA